MKALGCIARLVGCGVLLGLTLLAATIFGGQALALLGFL